MIIIHHIEINVSNLKISKHFYDFLLTKLGYTLFQEWAHGVSYSYENHYIVFVQTLERHQQQKFNRTATGLNHLAFSLFNTTDIDALRLELLEYGVTELYPESYPYAGGPNHYAFFFEDPDRLKLEITVRDNLS